MPFFPVGKSSFNLHNTWRAQCRCKERRYHRAKCAKCSIDSYSKAYVKVNNTVGVSILIDSKAKIKDKLGWAIIYVWILLQ